MDTLNKIDRFFVTNKSFTHTPNSLAYKYSCEDLIWIFIRFDSRSKLFWNIFEQISHFCKIDHFWQNENNTTIKRSVLQKNKKNPKVVIL
jgi:hypothetical protein